MPSCIDGQCSSEALAQVEEYRMTFCGKSHLAMGSWQKNAKNCDHRNHSEQIVSISPVQAEAMPFLSGQSIKNP